MENERGADERSSQSSGGLSFGRVEATERRGFKSSGAAVFAYGMKLAKKFDARSYRLYCQF
jgi:hypothetical protein